MQAAALLNLLQFASPACRSAPTAIRKGWRRRWRMARCDADTARAWIVRHLHEVVAQWEAPIAGA
jgi:urease accessory protein